MERENVKCPSWFGISVLICLNLCKRDLLLKERHFLLKAISNRFYCVMSNCSEFSIIVQRTFPIGIFRLYKNNKCLCCHRQYECIHAVQRCILKENQDIRFISPAITLEITCMTTGTLATGLLQGALTIHSIRGQAWLFVIFFVLLYHITF